MYRLVLPVILAAACHAQNPTDLFTRAPKAIDDALRARISEFFQDHVDGKYRQAEQLVAEDTKDFFYTANKPKYLGFEIRAIDYTDDFTKARATVVVQQFLLMPGFGDKPLSIPISSYWKIEQGKWVWYVDRERLSHTPWGIMKGESSSGDKAGAPMPPMPNAADMAGMLQQVKVDRSEVALEEGKAGQVTFSNGAAGAITLSFLGPPPAGIEAKFDHTELKAGEQAVLSLRATGTPKTKATLQVRVDPTNQVIPIQISAR